MRVRVRPNPRERSHIGWPWDVAVPFEYLPEEQRRVCLEALEAGHLAWAGAFSQKEPGQSAHFVAHPTRSPRLPGLMRDALKAAGFKKGWLLPGHWYWSSRRTIRPNGRIEREADPREVAILLAEQDMAFGVRAACAAARWSLQANDMTQRVDPRALRTIELAEASLLGNATGPQVQRAWQMAADVGNRAATMARANMWLSVSAAARAAEIRLVLLEHPDEEDREFLARVVSNGASYCVSSFVSAEVGRASSGKERAAEDFWRPVVQAELSDILRYQAWPG